MIFNILLISIPLISFIFLLYNYSYYKKVNNCCNNGLDKAQMELLKLLKYREEAKTLKDKEDYRLLIGILEAKIVILKQIKNL